VESVLSGAKSLGREVDVPSLRPQHNYRPKLMYKQRGEAFMHFTVLRLLALIVMALVRVHLAGARPSAIFTVTRVEEMAHRTRSDHRARSQGCELATSRRAYRRLLMRGVRWRTPDDVTRVICGVRHCFLEEIRGNDAETRDRKIGIGVPWRVAPIAHSLGPRRKDRATKQGCRNRLSTIKQP
jgi:hypothetical protein